MVLHDCLIDLEVQEVLFVNRLVLYFVLYDIEHVHYCFFL